MKFLVCPQCGIRRFHVKDEVGNAITVQVTTDFEIVPVDPFQSLDGFNLDIPVSVEGVDQKLLNPREAWADTAAYDEAAQNLVAKFVDNFGKFEVDPGIVAAGPNL